MDEDVTIVSDSDSESDVQVLDSLDISSPRPRKPGFCRKCHANPVQVACYPCMHASCCKDCFISLKDPKRCPYCNARVKFSVEFYLS